MAPLLLVALVLAGCGGSSGSRPYVPSPPPRPGQVGVEGVGPPVGAALLATCSPYERCEPTPVPHPPRVLAPSGGFVVVTVPARAGTVYGTIGAGHRILRRGDAAPLDSARTRWRVRMPVGIPPGTVLTLRVSPLRTDAGGMILRVRLVRVAEIA